jgi:YggT family protein
MLSTTVYPIFAMIAWAVFGVFAGLLLFRLAMGYADPNPFGALGRLSFKVRKLTERWVYPAARFFAMYRINTKFAPLLTIFIALVMTYFLVQIVGNTCFVIDGVSRGILTGNASVIIGFLLYGLLSVLVLFIFLRFLASWFVFTQKTFFAFVVRVTDPIMLPVQRLIPPIGMFDISAMLVLLIIGFLQSIILRTFVF